MQQLIATVYNIKHNNTIIPNTDNDGTKEQYIIGCVRLRGCFQNKRMDRFCRVSAASGTSGKSGVNQGIQLILEIIGEVSRKLLVFVSSIDQFPSMLKKRKKTNSANNEKGWFPFTQ